MFLKKSKENDIILIAGKVMKPIKFLRKKSFHLMKKRLLKNY